jgi:formylglycine-generating enzyme required for sulfatase activity
MRLFVSYARVDKSYCIQIVDTLDVHETWFDQRLYAGQNWWREIVRRLDWCEGFVYLLSPDSVNSEYCRKEFELAKNLGRHIFPILIRENTTVPEALADVQYINLSKGITLEGVKMLLNSIHIAERQQQSNGAKLATISPEEIKQPAVNSATVIKVAATAMENGNYDQAVFLLKQAKANGYTSKFINIDAILKEAEASLERQAYVLEAEREYKQILELVRHKATERLGWEAFEAFRRHYPDYDPEKLSQVERARLPQPAKAMNGSRSQTLVLPTLSLPLLEFVDVPRGVVELVETEGEGKPKKKRVEVPAFAISKYPITNAQFDAFINDPSGYANIAHWQFSAKAYEWRLKNAQAKQPKFKGDERPREMVTWYEAMAFCNWLSMCYGWNVTLPTSAQWQRAFQGDDGRAYPWGSTFDKDRCNTSESAIKMTTLVTRYPSGVSPYGVYDMAGNVWEWCLDNPLSSAQNAVKQKCVIRGGSYIGPQQRADGRFQYELEPETYHASIGFRVVQNLKDGSS